MRGRLLWALTKTAWATAVCAFLLAAYMQTGPRFYGG